MNENAIIYLPTSLGEAIDKLTILDIKIENIVDGRRDNVKREYDLLYEKLQKYIINYNSMYLIMKKVNLLIWNMMDKIRDGNLSDEDYFKICKECVEYNDVRFRVKNKINNICESYLKEEKGYKINKLVIVVNQDIQNNLTLQNIIKYVSFIYDEINIISHFNLETLKNYFLYDNSILFKVDTEITEYKNKVVIENKQYSEDELYELFSISKIETYKII